jgi:hypothetical protein
VLRLAAVLQKQLVATRAVCAYVICLKNRDVLHNVPYQNHG